MALVLELKPVKRVSKKTVSTLKVSCILSLVEITLRLHATIEIAVNNSVQIVNRDNLMLFKLAQERGLFLNLVLSQI